MEFRILGPLEIEGEAGPVTVRRGKEQALLAYMLLHPNQVLPRDRLIDALWDERAPATASKILQNAISQLRRALGDGRIETRAPGYVLHLEPDELDAERFERLAREGRGEEALALWRGDPLTELREERFADDARRRLDELRLTALEDRIDADLEQGRPDELVAELMQLVARHPLRERLQGQLMRALYAAGRQADALDAFRRARRTLSEEVGLEPGPQLQELERRILRQDPALAPPLTAPGSDRRKQTRLVLFVGLVVLTAAAALIAYLVTREDGTALAGLPNSLVRIDPSTNRILSVVRVGRRPAAIAGLGSDLWVANSLDDTLTHVDTRAGTTRTLGGFEYPTSLASDGHRLWVSSNARGLVVAIDLVTGAVVDRLRIGGSTATSSLAYDGASSLWISEEEAAVRRVDVETGAVTLRVSNPQVHQIAYGEGAAWAVIVGLRRLLQIDARNHRNRDITVGPLPTGVAVGFGAVWVASAEDDTIWRIDPGVADVTDVIHVGDRPEGVAIAAGSVWVANNAAGTVSRIDPSTNEVTATVHTGYHPLAIGADTASVWIAVSAEPEA
jgi:YVTN family beta-propeller protein